MQITDALRAAGMGEAPQFIGWIQAELAKPYGSDVEEQAFRNSPLSINRNGKNFDVEKLKVYRIGIEELVVRFPKSVFGRSGGIKKVRCGLHIQNALSSEAMRVEDVAFAILKRDSHSIEYQLAKEQVFKECSHIVEHRGAFKYKKPPDPSKGGAEVVFRSVILSRFYNLKDLQGVAFQREFNEEVCLSCVRQIFHGIEALHKMGYIHRDLKLVNIFVNQESDGRLHVVIGDLDFVQFSDNAKGKVGGTPEMMSPEYLYFFKEHSELKKQFKLLLGQANWDRQEEEKIIRDYNQSMDQLWKGIFHSKEELEALDLWGLGLLLDFLREHVNKDNQWISAALYPDHFWVRFKENRLSNDNKEQFRKHLICLFLNNRTSFPSFASPPLEELPPERGEMLKGRDCVERPVQETPFMGLLRELIQGFLTIDPCERLKLDPAIEKLESFIHNQHL